MTRIGIDVIDFKNEIINPALSRVYFCPPEICSADYEFKNFNSRAAKNLLIGTALVESNLSNLTQIGGGPGRGLFQIERETFDFIYNDYLQRKDKAGLKWAVDSFKSMHYKTSDEKLSADNNFKQVIGNLQFAVLIARIRYWLVSAPMPEHDDVEALAEYWGTYYNTRRNAESMRRFEEYYTEIYLSRNQ